MNRKKYLFLCFFILVLILIPTPIAAEDLSAYSIHTSKINVDGTEYDVRAIVDDICSKQNIENQLTYQADRFGVEKLYVNTSKYVVQNIQSQDFLEELPKINDSDLADGLFFKNQYIYVPILADIEGRERMVGSICIAYDWDKNVFEGKTYFYSHSKNVFANNEVHGFMESLYNAIDNTEATNSIWVQLTEPMPNNGTILLIETNGVYSVFDYQNILGQSEGDNVYSIEEFVSLKNLYDAKNKPQYPTIINPFIIVLFVLVVVAIVVIMIKRKRSKH